MNRQTLIAVASLVLAGFLAGVAIYQHFTIVSLKARCVSDIKVGVYYYAWYEGGLGNGVWNGTPPEHLCPKQWTVVDKPVLGWYNSCDPDLIKAHWGMFKQIGFDFVLISWWGENSTSDNATRVIFDVVSGLKDNDVKIALSVEGCNESGVYNFDYLHGYIYDNYAEPYNGIWFRVNNKPLLTWMETTNMTNPPENREAIHSDDRFVNRIIGYSSWVDWFGWFPHSYSSSKVPKLSDLDGGFTSIVPRYDDHRLCENRNTIVDVDYSEGLYKAQWDKALKWIKQGRCKYVCVATWNDFTERTQIEPCFDLTSFTDYPFYLSDLTREYIQQLSIRDSVHDS